MAYRHKVQARKHGGGVYAHLPNVQEENKHSVVAESRKRKDGGAVEERADGGAVEEEKERKKGGRVERKFGGAITGAKTAARADRPGRKSGGRVGCDTAPLSSAARSSAAKHSEQH